MLYFSIQVVSLRLLVKVLFLPQGLLSVLQSLFSVKVEF